MGFLKKFFSGKEAAMACTVAVEASITEHYNDQVKKDFFKKSSSE